MTSEDKKLLIVIVNKAQSNFWGMLATALYSTGHWAGATVALLFAIYMAT